MSDSLEVYPCKCAWRKSGLGAEIAKPNIGCPIHGIGGPMPMFMRSEIQEKAVGIGPDETATTAGRVMKTADLHRQASMLKAKAAESAAMSSDDRHAFSSGAMSSGKRPDYAEIFDRLTMTLLERTTAQRRYGDNKYGKDNWKKGARDKAFILDRINHGIEHLITLYRQVTNDDSGSWEPGHDDAAAVACCAMFVMEWQREQDQHARTMERLKRAEDSRFDELSDKSAKHYDGPSGHPV